MNNLLVISKQTGNKSIEDFGSPDKWLQENAKLLGEDVWKGEQELCRASHAPCCVATLQTPAKSLHQACLKPEQCGLVFCRAVAGLMQRLVDLTHDDDALQPMQVYQDLREVSRRTRFPQPLFWMYKLRMTRRASLTTNTRSSPEQVR